MKITCRLEAERFKTTRDRGCVVRHIVDSDRIERSLAHMALRPVSTSIRTIPVLVLVLRCTGIYVAVNSRGDLEDIESRQLRQATCFTVRPTVERGEREIGG